MTSIDPTIVHGPGIKPYMGINIPAMVLEIRTVGFYNLHHLSSKSLTFHFFWG